MNRRFAFAMAFSLLVHAMLSAVPVRPAGGASNGRDAAPYLTATLTTRDAGAAIPKPIEPTVALAQHPPAAPALATTDDDIAMSASLRRDSEPGLTIHARTPPVMRLAPGLQFIEGIGAIDHCKFVVDVGESGRANDAKVLGECAIPERLFRQIRLAILREAIFVPGTYDRVPVPGTTVIQVDFSDQ